MQGMFWDEGKETLAPDELARLQLKRLKKTLKSAQNIEFYRKQFSESGIRVSDIRTLEDVRKLPFTKKQDLRSGYPFGFLAVPLKQVVRIHTTSGTTGKPTVVCYTRNDLEAWSDLIARNMTMIGLGENDVFQNMVNYGMFTGGLGFHYGAEKIGMTVIPSATGNTTRQIEMIQDFGVTAIHCTPSYAMHLAEVAEERHADLPSLKTGIFGAEPWSESMRSEARRKTRGDGVPIPMAFQNYSAPELHSSARKGTVFISGMTTTLSR